MPGIVAHTHGGVRRRTPVVRTDGALRVTGQTRGVELSLHDLRRTFGDVVAVDGLSFAVPAGRLFGFVGRNGAGKTTTMRIVCGLLAADAGTVLWDGRPTGPSFRTRIGYMPEERGLYPKMRVGEQLEYLAVLHGAPRADARRAVAGWLERLGLGDRAASRADELSQGNQQRVQLAAALVHRPDLLVLDEPFAGLDPIATDLLAEVLREEAARGAAILFSSHQLELVEDVCEEVAIIDAGRLVACGAVGDLRATGPRHVRIDVHGGEPAWPPGATVVERSGDRTLLALADGGDPQEVLAAGQRAGVVTHFAELRPSLAELFRELVA
jgi:ABC-2 type transport system ATP-binding protein